MKLELFVFAFLFVYGYGAATIPIAGRNGTVANLAISNSLGKEYKLEYFSKATFLNAHLSCLNCGMRLATINSQEEQVVVVNLIKQYGLSNESFWLSGTDLAEEGRFSWLTTGKIFQYTNWSPRQPDNKNEEEHCVHLWDQTNLQWNDAQCNLLMYFICERSFECD